jgi:hypothetical protein
MERLTKYKLHHSVPPKRGVSALLWKVKEVYIALMTSEKNQEKLRTWPPTPGIIECDSFFLEVFSKSYI